MKAPRKERAIPSPPAALGYRMPAEWEPHAATWLAWPHEKTDWPGKFAPIPWVYADIVRHLSQGERVRILVEDAAMERAARRNLKSAGANLAAVDFLKIFCIDRFKFGMLCGPLAEDSVHAHDGILNVRPGFAFETERVFKIESDYR